MTHAVTNSFIINYSTNCFLDQSIGSANHKNCPVQIPFKVKFTSVVQTISLVVFNVNYFDNQVII